MYAICKNDQDDFFEELYKYSLDSLRTSREIFLGFNALIALIILSELFASFFIASSNSVFLGIGVVFSSSAMRLSVLTQLPITIPDRTITIIATNTHFVQYRNLGLLKRVRMLQIILYFMKLKYIGTP